MFSRPLTISLSPNTEADDVRLALQTMFTISKWKKGESLESVKTWFKSRFASSCVVLYNSGRSAELEILRAFGIGSGDEVLIQAFTCVAVPNSILWSGATPVYVDVDSSLTLDVSSIEKHITNKTKAIIVQHTFGIPAEIDAIVEIAHKHNVLVIEDCAHTLSSSYKGKLLGTWGDAAFFSFGRDKVVSSVFGGAAIIADRHVEAAETLQKNHDALPYPSFFWIMQQLFHPIAFALILPLYTSGIGKVLLFLFQRLKFLSFPVYPVEKKGENPGMFPQKYPNALSVLVYHQLQKLDRYDSLRNKISELYRRTIRKSEHIGLVSHREGTTYLRFPIFVNVPDTLLNVFKKDHILLGNWYRTAIDPKGTDFLSVKYQTGMCPVAEERSSKVLNLPTRISLEDAQRILEVLQLEL